MAHLTHDGSGVSHKSADKSLVIRVKETLELLKFEPWLDIDAMPAGAGLEQGILKGFRDSCTVVFFIPPKFKDENFLATEIEYAIFSKRSKGYIIERRLIIMERGITTLTTPKLS